MRWSVTLMLAAALVISVMPSASLAQTDDDDEGLLTLRPELSAGPWLGSGSAGGTTTADAGGMHMEFTADYTANFFFDVTTDGVTTGEWDIQGPVLLDATGNGGSFHMVGDLAGTGPVTGDAVRLSVDGSTTTNGTATVSAGGQTFTRDVSNSSGNPTIDIDVTTTFCNEAYGEWIVSVNQKLEDFSWDPTFSGSWVATKQVDAFGELTGTEQAEIVDGLVDVVDEYNVWVDPDGDDVTRSVSDLSAEWEFGVDLAERANDLTNRLRNLSQCDRELIGEERIEGYLNLLTELVATTIRVALEAGELTGTDVRFLVSTGLNVGTLGAGSSHPLSAEMMEGLRVTAEDILNDNLDYDGMGVTGPCAPNGCVNLTDEVMDILTAGWQAGWTFAVGGLPLIPGAAITKIVGSQLGLKGESS